VQLVVDDVLIVALIQQVASQQAVIGELKRQDIAVRKPSEVNDDLAQHALRELERKGAPA